MKTFKEYKEIFIPLMKKGAIDQALLVANEISDKFPNNHLGYTFMGDALRARGDHMKAISCYKLSLDKEPNQAFVHLALGDALSALGKKSEAFHCYHKALELEPKNSRVLRNVANFLVTSGYLQDAKDMLEEALKYSNEKELLNSMLEIHLREGNKEAIREFLGKHKKDLKKLPGNVRLANALISLGENEAAIKYLKKMKGFNNKVWLSAYYASLAKAYEKHKDYRSAFKAFQQQNDVYPRAHKPAVLELQVQRLIADKIGVLKEPVREDDDTLQPLFIVGLPRSGTTLTEQVLSTADEVVVAGELEYIGPAFNKFVKGESLEDLAKWYMEKLRFVLKENFEQSGNEKDMSKVRWVVDKLPGNFFYLNFIARLFPKSKVIYLVRNPIDVGLSIYKQNFSKAHSYANNLKDIAHFVSIERKMEAHWEENPPLPIHFLEYKNLVTNFDEETKKLFDFLDLSWSENVKDFYKSERYAVTASWEQVRNPVNTKALGSYKRYEEELQPLIQRLQKLGVDISE